MQLGRRRTRALTMGRTGDSWADWDRDWGLVLGVLGPWEAAGVQACRRAVVPETGSLSPQVCELSLGSFDREHRPRP